MDLVPQCFILLVRPTLRDLVLPCFVCFGATMICVILLRPALCDMACPCFCFSLPVLPLQRPLLSFFATHDVLLTTHNSRLSATTTHTSHMTTRCSLSFTAIPLLALLRMRDRDRHRIYCYEYLMFLVKDDYD